MAYPKTRQYGEAGEREGVEREGVEREGG